MHLPGDDPAPYKLRVNFGKQLKVARDSAVPLALDILAAAAGALKA